MARSCLQCWLGTIANLKRLGQGKKNLSLYSTSGIEGRFARPALRFDSSLSKTFSLVGTGVDFKHTIAAFFYRRRRTN